MGTWHCFKTKPNLPRRLNYIRGKNLENDIVMSVHITSLRPRLLLTLSQCNRCFVVGVDDTHTKTVAPIVSIEESFDSSFFLVCLKPRGRQGDRCKYMLRVYVFIFLDAFYVLSAPWTRCSLGRTGIVWKSISSVNYWRFSWVYFFLGGLSCGEANARMGDCESGPIAACLFLLSVLSFVSLQQPQGRWIGRNVLSGILSPTDTAIAVLDSLNIFLLANQELPHRWEERETGQFTM